VLSTDRGVLSLLSRLSRRGGGLPMEARTQLSKKKIELEKTLSLV
jgi:hypothetical protein